MKKRLIKTLKNEILVIETPEETYFEVFKHGILFKDHLESEREFIEGYYTLLGSPDEIKEEDAKELVQYLTRRDLTITPKNYSKGKDGRFEDIIFTESLLSAIESEIYWVNPVKLMHPLEYLKRYKMYHYDARQWEEAQEKTFDKSRTLIFIKN